MANCLQVDMRKVGHLVGRDDGIDERSETVSKCSRADRALLSDGPNDAACGSCVVRRQLILLLDHLIVFGKRR
jgi:hypothetical protein